MTAQLMTSTAARCTQRRLLPFEMLPSEVRSKLLRLP